ncbi:ankyrin repeat domain-containing protein [bacterium]|nr:MAG: ankyrin repeat domain-containing protein [bacterium]
MALIVATPVVLFGACLYAVKDGLRKKADPFYTAVWDDDYTTLERLLKQGRRPDDPDELDPLNSETTLTYAVLQRDFKMAEFLVKHGADPRKVEFSYRSFEADKKASTNTSYQWLLKHGVKRDLEVENWLRQP